MGPLPSPCVTGLSPHRKDQINRIEPMTDAALELAGVAEQSVRTFIEVRNAYNECDPEIQTVIDEMVEICHGPEAGEDEKRMALTTIMEALYPSLSTDLLSMEKGARQSPEGKASEESLDAEEERFAKRLRKHMKACKMTQKQLAAEIRVGQPAISNMLNRQCRPQQRTVKKLAKALGVTLEDLWPGKSD